MINEQSPCINVCRYSSTVHNDKEIIYCIGCYRSYDEISRWNSYSDSEKQFIKLELKDRKINFNL